MDEKMRQEIALHRSAGSPRPPARADRLRRGAVVRQIAAREHAHPDGTRRRYSRRAVDRWLRAWRPAGWTAAPVTAADTGKVRAVPELSAEAAALRLELPAGPRSRSPRSCITGRRAGRRADHVRAAAPRRAAPGRAEAAPKAYGRYEADRANERSVTDVFSGRTCRTRNGTDRCGPGCSSSSMTTAGCWRMAGSSPGERPRLPGPAAPRDHPQRRPGCLYADNGARFANAWLARTCAVLGTRLVHSKPYSRKGGESRKG